MHTSLNKTTLEVYKDKQNIDFIRYYTRHILFGNILGILIRSFFWIYLDMDLYALMVTEEQSFLLFTLFSVAVIALGTRLAHQGTQEWNSALWIVLRRGLISFLIIAIGIILFFVSTSRITWQIPFGMTTRYLLIGEIFFTGFCIIGEYMTYLFLHHKN